MILGRGIILILSWTAWQSLAAQAIGPSAAGPNRQSAAPILESPLTPEQSLQSFQLEPGLTIELVAAEPLIADPVALAFDERGRLFVVENRGYPTGQGAGKAPEGRISLLEDLDRDGRFEKGAVFADGLSFPNGIMPWKGGLFVTCAPDLLYLKDTDGDGRSDLKEVVFTGFATNSSTQLRVSHPTLGLDNWIYLASGLSGGKIRSPQFPNHPLVDIARADFRFRPGSDHFEPADGKAQFGLTFDDFGHRFVCMNRVHIKHVVLESRYLQRNPHLAFSDTMQNVPESMLPEPLRGHGSAARIHPISNNITTADSHAGTFTAACGLLIYRGNGLPPDFVGNAMACDPTGNLVHRDRLAPSGPTFTARSLSQGKEMLASTDNWFRPVNLAIGPDGALYICDMYRKTIEHPDYLPEEIRKRTDFDGGKGMGRIFRLRAAGAKKSQGKASPDLGRLTAKQLAAQLSHPNGWARDTAHRLLLEKNDRAAVPALKKLLQPAGADPASRASARRSGGTGASAAARARALRLLEAFTELDEPAVAQALADPHPGVREQAIQIMEQNLSRWPRLSRRLLELSEDPDPRVRFQCALTLGELASEESVSAALASIAWRDRADRWTRAAVLSSIERGPHRFYSALLDRIGGGNDRSEVAPNHSGLCLLLAELGRMLGAGRPVEQLQQWFIDLSAPSMKSEGGWELSLAGGWLEGMRDRAKSPGDAPAGLPALAKENQELIDRWVKRSRDLAIDPYAPLEVRLASIGILAEGNWQTYGKVLLGFLQLEHPVSIQTAAVRALAQISDPAVVSILTARESWNRFTPAVREAMISALMAHPRHLEPLLKAVENGALPVWSIDSGRRKQLLQHRDESIRRSAAALFSAPQSEDRRQTYQKLTDALKILADARRGKTVFQKLCASCHRLDREGVPVGPDLFGIRNQPKETILLHIVVPEYEIAPAFAAYELELRDGRNLFGLIASETPASLTLRVAAGQEETVLRRNIHRITASSLSLMPQELEKNMTRQELADLLAYLKGE